MIIQQISVNNSAVIKQTKVIKGSVLCKALQIDSYSFELSVSQ